MINYCQIEKIKKQNCTTIVFLLFARNWTLLWFFVLAVANTVDLHLSVLQKKLLCTNLNAGPVNASLVNP